MKRKSTIVRSSDKHLAVSIVVTDVENSISESYNIELPFSVVPPQIAHQIASQLAMCNSYYVDESESK